MRYERSRRVTANRNQWHCCESCKVRQIGYRGDDGQLSVGTYVTQSKSRVRGLNYWLYPRLDGMLQLVAGYRR
jgi:hypothetical protein